MNETLDQKIIEAQKTVAPGVKVRAIRDGSELKKGTVTRVTSAGVYMFTPKEHNNQQVFDCGEGRFDEFFYFRNFKENKLAGGVVLA